MSMHWKKIIMQRLTESTLIGLYNQVLKTDRKQENSRGPGSWNQPQVKELEQSGSCGTAAERKMTSITPTRHKLVIKKH